MKWKEERWIYYNLFSAALQKDFYYYRVGLMLYREPELWKNFSTWLDGFIPPRIYSKYFPNEDINRCIIFKTSKQSNDVHIELHLKPLENKYRRKKYIIYDFRQKSPPISLSM